MKNKKSQGAMDFLMTYGWAILSAVIVIGVLASFGVFSPDTSIEKDCLREKVCENLNMEFSSFWGNKVDCNEIINEGVYTEHSFIVDYDELIKIYPECSIQENEKK